MKPVPLNELFVAEDPPQVISLGGLAQSLRCAVARVAPLVREGWLKARSTTLQGINSGTLVEAPGKQALLWLQSWVQPPTTKQVWSLGDLAELTGKTEREVLKLAAREKVPTVHDPGFGLMFSAWAARTVIRASVTKITPGRAANHYRFDRQAMLWMILDADPEQALATMPKYDHELEQELARAGRLEEPQRSRRLGELVRAWRDSCVAIDALTAATATVERSPAEQSQPVPPASGSSSSGNAQLRAACEKKFSGLLACE